MQLLNYDLPLKLTGTFIFADELGDAERDTEAGRLKLVYDPMEFSSVTLGASKYVSQNKMNDDVHQKYDNYEFDLGYEHTFEQSSWANPMILNVNTEYFYYENKNEFNKFGEDPYVINEDYVWNKRREMVYRNRITISQSFEIEF